MLLLPVPWKKKMIYAHTKGLRLLLLFAFFWGSNVVLGSDETLHHPWETSRAQKQVNPGRNKFLYLPNYNKQDDREEEDHPIEEYVDESIALPHFLLGVDQNHHHHMVVFYSPTCPHCIHFAPKYKQFARYFQSLLGGNSTTFSTSSVFHLNHKLKFWAVSCVVHKQLCRQQKIKSYPTGRLFLAAAAAKGKDNHNDNDVVNSTSQETTTTIDLAPDFWDLHPYSMLKLLGEGFVEDTWMTQPQQQPSVATTKSLGQQFRTQAQIYGDAYLAFYQSMMPENSFALSGQQKQKKEQQQQVVLLPFLKVLSKTLPPWRIHFLLEELTVELLVLRRPHHRRGSKGVVPTSNSSKEEANAINENWLDILGRHRPSQLQYSPGCQHKKHSSLSPYICGLWSLFQS
mgnify:CR=1 FL=1